MSNKAKIIWGIWVGFLAAAFNLGSNLLPTAQYLCNGKGAAWVEFVVLAVMAVSGWEFSKWYKAAGSMLVGLLWGQVDMMLAAYVPGFTAGHMFGAVAVGTALTIIVHLCFFPKAFCSTIPIIFVGVCLTFGTGGHFLTNPGGILALGINLMLGLLLSFLVIWVELWLVKNMPAEPKAE